MCADSAVLQRSSVKPLVRAFRAFTCAFHPLKGAAPFGSPGLGETQCCHRYFFGCLNDMLFQIDCPDQQNKTYEVSLAHYVTVTLLLNQVQ